MQETCVTATDFRTHLTDLANAVAERGERVIMARHRFAMVALVSEEDLEFLRQHRPLPNAPAAEPEPVAEKLPPHPEDIHPVAELERIYQEMKGRKDDLSMRWREKAWLTLKLRTGKTPVHPWDEDTS
jgi:PHD/YefM family antitoxin component YafN of YafNO toxin-antitoxin module